MEFSFVEIFWLEMASHWSNFSENRKAGKYFDKEKIVDSYNSIPSIR